MHCLLMFNKLISNIYTHNIFDHGVAFSLMTKYITHIYDYDSHVAQSIQTELRRLF